MLKMMYLECKNDKGTIYRWIEFTMNGQSYRPQSFVFRNYGKGINAESLREHRFHNPRQLSAYFDKWASGKVEVCRREHEIISNEQELLALASENGPLVDALKFPQKVALYIVSKVANFFEIAVTGDEPQVFVVQQTPNKVTCHYGTW